MINGQHFDGARMKGAPLDHLDFDHILEHYRNRLATSKTLRRLIKKRDIRNYVNLALGVTDASGNYSASEHHLGHQVLNGSSNESVFGLAESLSNCRTASEIPELIYRAAIPYLKISVGSEMAMMLQPDRFWVANTRSVWAHLLIKHEFNYGDANYELSAYRENKTSEMNYSLWKKIYSDMHPSLASLGTLGNEASTRAGLETDGLIQHLWYDAIANEIYAHVHEH